ncbi:winged helix-turn-helix transcriptional regulator [Streptomyces montanus]|uniref:Winged helix-turn-helix transcriptional regulator n=1 Tax=Streptomyces montanus TaxID=2580423 RepID=A0A5R9FML1_9ACTN|nr:winged helix-turn-helix domain-containing protein [Streptomyces montanus]TLS43366.1 winged helix-turn-helix transcriptional regulator [Streptomyces montanus]
MLGSIRIPELPRGPALAFSLHRFQTRRGRWAYAGWYRTARTELQDRGLDCMVRTLLLPLFPRAAYFPDFLTPAQAGEGLDAGLEAIVATPRRRVLREVGILARVSGAPAWAPALADRETRGDLVRALRAYHDALIAPHTEILQARLDATRSDLARGLIDQGAEALLRRLGPRVRWRAPVLTVDYSAAERDLHLNGRGLVLIPSYFCWGTPVSLADPGLPPVLLYPLLHEAPPQPADPSAQATLAALLGRTRAATLHLIAAGATTGELARALGISPATATHHTTSLRNAHLITSHRHTTTVLHTLTPLGAALLKANTQQDHPTATRPTARGQGRGRA